MAAGRQGTAAVGLLTLIDAEFAAVRQVFALNDHILGSNYAIRAASQTGMYEVVATRSDQWGNVRAGQILRALLEDFQPPYVILVGIAGGIVRPSDKQPVCLGDVIIPNYISYFELKKLISGKTERALVPYDHPSHYLRRQFAEPLCSMRPDKWVDKITVGRPETGTPKAVIGHLVAGESLLGDDESKVQQQVLKDFPTAIAIDMESYGVASEIYNQRVTEAYNPQYLVIRGISDLVRPKQKGSDPVPVTTNQEMRDRWREYAAHVASTFARALVDDLLRIYSSSPLLPAEPEGGTA